MADTTLEQLAAIFPDVGTLEDFQRLHETFIQNVPEAAFKEVVRLRTIIHRAHEILNPNSSVNYDPKHREEAVLKILEEM